MLEKDSGTIREVAWSEIFPWLSIFRTFRLACSFRMLLLGAAGFLLMLTGWAVLGKVFDVDAATARWMAPGDGCPWHAMTGAEDATKPFDSTDTSSDTSIPIASAIPTNDPIIASWVYLTRPFFAFFELKEDGPLREDDPSNTPVICLMLAGLWSLAVWAFFGGAITRIAAVELACGERVGLGAALRFTASRWLSYFASPLFPLAGVLALAIPIVVLGFFSQANLGLVVAGLLWPLALVAGLLSAILLLGLIFGWPLMWATVSTEGTDTFDALSRSYDYVFHKPLHYLFYLLVAAMFGTLGWLLVDMFADGVIHVTYWAASWGAGADTILAIKKEAATSDGRFGAALIGNWIGCVNLLVAGFVYSYFWTAIAAIYLLLRKNQDNAEMDEVFLDADASESTFGLPPLKTDAAGVPAVDDRPKTPPPADESDEKKPSAE